MKLINKLFVRKESCKIYPKDKWPLLSFHLPETNADESNSHNGVVLTTSFEPINIASVFSFSYLTLIFTSSDHSFHRLSLTSRSSTKMAKDPVRVLVTGAAGNRSVLWTSNYLFFVIFLIFFLTLDDLDLLFSSFWLELWVAYRFSLRSSY